jgi:hypothetical protein
MYHRIWFVRSSARYRRVPARWLASWFTGIIILSSAGHDPMRRPRWLSRGIGRSSRSVRPNPRLSIDGKFALRNFAKISNGPSSSLPTAKFHPVRPSCSQNSPLAVWLSSDALAAAGDIRTNGPGTITLRSQLLLVTSSLLPVRPSGVCTAPGGFSRAARQFSVDLTRWRLVLRVEPRRLLACARSQRTKDLVQAGSSAKRLRHRRRNAGSKPPTGTPKATRPQPSPRIRSADKTDPVVAATPPRPQ